MDRVTKMKFEDGKIHDKPLIYLAGAMPRNSDSGKKWREDITPHLRNMGYRVWNPYIEECQSGVSPKELASYRKKDRKKEYAAACRQIVEHDLNILRFETDVVLVKIDRHCFGSAGTWGEMTFAHRLGIPVIGWLDVEGDYRSISGWAVGCMDVICYDVEEVIKFVPPAKPFRRLTGSEDSWFSFWKDKLPDI